jgi:hypothetical protein
VKFLLLDRLQDGKVGTIEILNFKESWTLISVASLQTEALPGSTARFNNKSLK